MAGIVWQSVFARFPEATRRRNTEMKTDRLEQIILWRRIDVPGHDACGLWGSERGWRLAGVAVFRQDEEPCCLSYEVRCDLSWRTRSASVTGWMGRTAVDLSMKALPGEQWAFNGAEAPEAAGLEDIDLGFTPATNLIQLRRFGLDVGQGVEAPAAYLYSPELRLGRLEQRYVRVALNAYEYQAPRFGYAAILEVSDAGFVTKYPGLWELEALD